MALCLTYYVIVIFMALLLLTALSLECKVEDFERESLNFKAVKMCI
jgi:hypothetical protein